MTALNIPVLGSRAAEPRGAEPHPRSDQVDCERQTPADISRLASATPNSTTRTTADRGSNQLIIQVV